MNDYKIVGINLSDVEKWKELLRDDARIFTRGRRGKHEAYILISLNKIEAIELRIQLFMYNFKHKTKLKMIKSI